MTRLITLLSAIALCWSYALAEEDKKSPQKIFKDATPVNPNPFWCNSVPQFAPCAQPAIPICCGPCYQGIAPAAAAGGAAVPAALPAGPAPAAGGPPPPAGGPPPAAGGPAPAAGGPAPAGGAGGAGAAVAPAATVAPGQVTPFVPPPGGGAAANVTPVAGAGGAGTGNCPIACPAGWSTWGLSESCYLMPAQPLHSDTFWNQEAYCKRQEPTSHILVVNGLVEQALGTGVSLQYFPSWAGQLTNIYWWLGGYTTPEGWKFVDGTDQSSSPLMLLAQIAANPKENGTCIGAEAKTLGEWQTYPCTDKNGAVICEMAKRPVCGAVGGNIPISPVSLSPDSLKNLFPKAPSIPFISGILGGGGGTGLGGLLGGGGGAAGPAAGAAGPAAGAAGPAGAAAGLLGGLGK